MKVLVFDTETTGFLKKDLKPDDPKQASIMQLAYQFYDNRRLISEFKSLIRPWTPDLHLDPGAFEVHGITIQNCVDYGVHEKPVLYCFFEMIRNCDNIVAHNFAFDYSMIMHVASRNHINDGDLFNIFSGKKKICTMMSSKDTVKAQPYKNGNWKWPKLQECATFFWDENISGAHDALVDVKYCTRVYWELVDRGIIIE